MEFTTQRVINKIVSSVIFFILTINLAQAKDNDAVKATRSLNNYVNFTNGAIKTLDYLQHSISQFNRLVNDYQYGRSSTIRFNELLATEIQVYDSKTVIELYDVAISGNEALMKHFRQPLVEHSGKLLQLILNIQKKQNMMAQYVVDKKFVNADNYNQPYQELEEVVNLFLEFKTTRDEIVKYLAYVHRSYRLRLVNRKLNLSYRMMRSWHSLTDNSLVNLDELAFEEAKTKTKQLKDVNLRLEELLGAVLPSLSETADEDVDLFMFFDTLSSSATLYTEYAERFLNHFKGEEFYYAKCGKPYKHYNKNNRNRALVYARTFTQKCNDFIDHSAEDFLKFVEDPPLFGYLDPREVIDIQPAFTSKEVEKKAVVKTPPVTPEPTIAKVEAPAPIDKKESIFNNALPNNLVLLLDVSQSMTPEYKLPLLREAFKNILQYMRPEDRVAIVIYSGDAETVLPSTSAANKDLIIEKLDNLNSIMRTDADKGIRMAYQEARKNFMEAGNNQIILATDGLFDLKKATYSLISRRLDRYSIHFSVFYFDKKEKENIKIDLEKLADEGNGSYFYIKEENIERTLIHQLTQIKKQSE